VSQSDSDPQGFFERYFAALDGPDPHASLELVADDVEFVIQWSAGSDRKSTQIVGGLAELRAFIDAGEMNGWGHHVLDCARDGQMEFALGETRWDTGERIGTFLAVAQLDADGRMRRYLVARTPALEFEREPDFEQKLRPDGMALDRPPRR
jgi:hypothetical protein